MAKSFKYEDDMYLDSSGIVHERKLLSNIINNSGLELIASVTLEENSRILELTNLSLEPGNYLIIVQEYSSSNSGQGHYLRINNISSGYAGDHIYRISGTMGNNTHDSGLCLCNGWDMGSALCHSVINLSYFNKDWLSVSTSLVCANSSRTLFANEGGSLLAKSVERIRKISLVPMDSDSIGAGSTMKLYKFK